MTESSCNINEHYAKFATTSRLVACLTSENLVPVHFVPASTSSDTFVGLCLLLRPSKEQNEIASSITLDKILAVVPLRGLPIIDNTVYAKWNNIFCPRIDLVDNIDMLPHIYQVTAFADKSENEFHHTLKSVLSESVVEFGLKDAYDAPALWTRFAEDYGVENALLDQIAQELNSSIIFQKHTYDNPKKLPTLNSPTYIWEQAVVEGHATHPMHKSRKSYPPMEPMVPGSYDLDHPKVRLVGIPRNQVVVRGEYETLFSELADAFFKSSGQDVQELHKKYDANYVYIAIHELQIPNVVDKFPDVFIFPETFSVTAEALASLRSVAFPTILAGRSVKLCLGVKISSALRTVSAFAAYFGPGFSKVVPHLTYDRDLLVVERELATVSYRHEDSDVSKHCSSVIREAVEYDAAYSHDVFIPCGVLVEKIQKPDTDETLVTRVWGLDTEEKRIEFLTRYVDIALRAFLPPCLENGVAFEAHGQNTLARFDRKTGLLKGFAIRDFGGIKVHKETLRKSTGCEVSVLPNSTVIAEEKDEVFKLLYHTLFHSQFQRLIRVLNLHYSGVGWEIVRKRTSELVPKDHIMWPMFIETDKVPGKCLLRMKIDELYRDYIYRPVPNMIRFKPQTVSE